LEARQQGTICSHTATQVLVLVLSFGIKLGSKSDLGKSSSMKMSAKPL
jgi:hypothetical protein